MGRDMPSGIKIEEYGQIKTLRIQLESVAYHAEVKYYRDEPISIVLKRERSPLAILFEKEKQPLTLDLEKSDVLVILEVAKMIGWVSR